MSNAFASHSYEKDLKGSQNHVEYICFRSEIDEGEKRFIFSKDSDNPEIRSFINSLDDNKTNHPQTATIHKLLFSMSGDEWERSGFTDGDYQKLIRDTMEDYEMATGRKLEWIAANHHRTDNPHVHVAVKAVYEDKDGVKHRLKFTNEDRKRFKDSFSMAKDRTRGFQLERSERSFVRSPQKNFHRAAARFIDSLFYQIDRDLEEQERQQGRGR